MIETDILVVGGGMVGAALALGAARMGYAVTVVDAGPAPRPPGPARTVGDHDVRVSALTRSSDYLLRALGVWEALRGHATPYRHMHVWEGGTPRSGAIRFDAESVCQPDLGHIVENSQTRWALWQALEAQPGVTCLPETRLKTLQVLDDGVEAGLADGDGIRAGMLVGADGARSWVRETLMWPTDERDYPHHALVANVRMARSHRYTAWQRFLPSGPLALLPLGGQGDETLISIVWSAWPDTLDGLMARSDEAFLEALTDASQGVLGDALEVGPRQAFPLRYRQAQRFVQGPVVLLGDAAHTIHPLAGQGVNLGFRDVIGALDVLARARDLGLPLAEPRLWQGWQRERRLDVTRTAAAMQFFCEVYGIALPGFMPLRRLGISVVNRLAPVKRRIMCEALGIPDVGTNQPPVSNRACRSRWAALSPP